MGTAHAGPGLWRPQVLIGTDQSRKAVSQHEMPEHRRTTAAHCRLLEMSRTHTANMYRIFPPVDGTSTKPLKSVLLSSHPVPPETMRDEPRPLAEATPKVKQASATAGGA